MPEEQVFSNYRIVLPNGEISGAVAVRDGRIARIDEGRSDTPGSLDGEGDYLVAGMVDIHTDNLEKHVEPRPGVRWPIMAALTAHDRQVAASGITTVFDALSIGFEERKPGRHNTLIEASNVLGQAQANGALRAEHLLHLRCEVSTGGLVDWFEKFIANPLVKMTSVMDHTPGQRQWRDLDKWRQFNSQFPDATDDYLDSLLASRREGQILYGASNRRMVIDASTARGIPVASHDDTTEEHVHEAAEEGITISEFPTTVEAAKLAREKGMKTIMGAPNVVKGGSHSGNASAQDLAQAGHLDGLASDYVPISMLHSAFILRDKLGLGMPDAMSMVSATPARVAGLDDRGEIVEGKRADLIRVREHDGFPVVMGVWREGRPVG